MGFTPLEGFDDGHPQRLGSIRACCRRAAAQGTDAEQLDDALNYQSGLLGVSGVSSDMRQVLAAAPGHLQARLAVDIYAHRIRQTVGALAATLGGVDAPVFTAGVGENSAEIRERVCEELRLPGPGTRPHRQRCVPAGCGYRLAGLDRPYPGHCHA